MSHEPDMFETPDIETVDLEEAKAHLDTLDDRAFEKRYKVTKRLVRALVQIFPALHELHEALTEPNPLEIDSELADNVRYMSDDLRELVEQMTMASYWEQEQESSDEEIS